MKSSAYQIPERARKIFLAIAPALITEPDDLIIHNKEEDYLEKIRTLLAEFPYFTRFGFLFLLYAFDRLTLFFGSGFFRFIHLKPDAQHQYVERWLTTDTTLLREVFKTIRGIIMVTYFSHHDIWRYIGYDPKKHVQERIAARHDVITKSKNGEGA